MRGAQAVAHPVELCEHHAHLQQQVVERRGPLLGGLGLAQILTGRAERMRLVRPLAAFATVLLVRAETNAAYAPRRLRLLNDTRSSHDSSLKKNLHFISRTKMADMATATA